MFGDGYIENFLALVDTHLSSHLSTYAYNFWRETGCFKSLFKLFESGVANRMFDFVSQLRCLVLKELQILLFWSLSLILIPHLLYFSPLKLKLNYRPTVSRRCMVSSVVFFTTVIISKKIKMSLFLFERRSSMSRRRVMELSL